MEENVATQKAEIEALSRHLDLVQCKVDTQEYDLDRLEAQSRRDNVRFFGIPEEDDDSYEGCAKTIVELLNTSYTEKEWTEIDVVRAHRIGRRAGKEGPRPMIVRFARWSDSLKLLKAKVPRDKLREQNIRVSADHTRRQAEQLGNLRRQGRVGVVRGGRVVEIEGNGRGRTSGHSETGDGRGGSISRGDRARRASVDNRATYGGADRTKEREQEQRQLPDRSPPGQKRNAPNRRPYTRSQSSTPMAYGTASETAGGTASGRVPGTAGGGTEGGAERD